jgi:exodeoxyribonuclease V alpha subunit
VLTDDQVEIEGTVSRVVYSNPDSHWTVIRIHVHKDGKEVPAVGTLAGVREGEPIRVWGRWVHDARFGKQIRVDRFKVVLPATKKGIERYLSSGLIPGIGPKTAQLLVRRFGDKTLDVISKNPERLRVVRGIGKKKIAQIIEAWREHAGLTEVMVFLQGIGISPRLATKIYQVYGNDTVGRVRANPYSLVDDITGVGFKTADSFAREMGIEDEHPMRVRAGVLYVLHESRKDGHVCIPRETLIRTAASTLAAAIDVIEEQVSTLEEAGRLIIESVLGDEVAVDMVFPRDLHRAEVSAAERLVTLLDAAAPALPDTQLKLIVSQAESELGLSLAPGQRHAVRTALESQVTVITGGPGTGKTTIVRAVVTALKKMGAETTLGAPTGRAAQRLSLSTGREAKTLHRILEWSPNEGGFTRDEDHPIEVDAMIIDEVSMVDLRLFDAVVRALPSGARLILVGDVDQLPSVGPGAVLRDIIDSGVVRVARLTDIFRQASDSLITENAHRILRGELPEQPPGGAGYDFYWIEKDEVDDVRRVIGALISHRIRDAFGFSPKREVQVLTPMHRGPLGSEGLNDLLGGILNPNRGGYRLAPGDKVMQVRNNYDKDVFNGDVGFVERYAEDGRTLVVHFAEPNPRQVLYEVADQDQLVLAWAISIHKSQGSEYPVVIAPIHTQHFVMLRRNLVYTAVTRGKRLVILVGSRKAMRRALGAATMAPRFGRLAQRLREFAA